MDPQEILHLILAEMKEQTELLRDAKVGRDRERIRDVNILSARVRFGSGAQSGEVPRTLPE